MALSTEDLEVVIRIAKKREALIDQMKAARKRGDRDEVWRLSALVAGIEDQPDEKCPESH